jgi:thiosulfate/3-mercaptopyruvate sulfurtransferase
MEEPPPERIFSAADAGFAPRSRAPESSPVERPLCSAQDLATRQGDPSVVIVDCRFDLMKPDAGRRAYEEGHIPGARYVDLNRDLSAPVIAGVTGRHPLPDPLLLSGTLGALGIDGGSTVVAYDDASGAIAARLWWLLLWLGHERACVLDGGLAAWQESGGALTADLPRVLSKAFSPQVREEMVAPLSDVEVLVRKGSAPLLDARATARFRGEQEPIDPTPGHIPSARSLPFSTLLEAGRFATPERVREVFKQALRGDEAEGAVCYCGSGVTACHLILGAASADLPLPRLYAGSYSEWIADGTRAVATGDE